MGNYQNILSVQSDGSLEIAALEVPGKPQEFVHASYPVGPIIAVTPRLLGHLIMAPNGRWFNRKVAIEGHSFIPPGQQTLFKPDLQKLPEEFPELYAVCQELNEYYPIPPGNIITNAPTWLALGGLCLLLMNHGDLDYEYVGDFPTVAIVEPNEDYLTVACKIFAGKSELMAKRLGIRGKKREEAQKFYHERRITGRWAYKTVGLYPTFPGKNFRNILNYVMDTASALLAPLPPRGTPFFAMMATQGENHHPPKLLSKPKAKKTNLVVFAAGYDVREVEIIGRQTNLPVLYFASALNGNVADTIVCRP